MGFWDDIKNGVRKVVLMEDRLDRLSARYERLADSVEDHNARLIRIETMIELARNGGKRRLPPK